MLFRKCTKALLWPALIYIYIYIYIFGGSELGSWWGLSKYWCHYWYWKWVGYSYCHWHDASMRPQAGSVNQLEESWKRNQWWGGRNHWGINHREGIIKAESWGRNHGGAIIEEKSWKRHLGSSRGSLWDGFENSFGSHSKSGGINLGSIWESFGRHLEGLRLRRHLEDFGGKVSEIAICLICSKKGVFIV